MGQWRHFVSGGTKLAFALNLKFSYNFAIAYAKSCFKCHLGLSDCQYPVNNREYPPTTHTKMPPSPPHPHPPKSESTAVLFGSYKDFSNMGEIKSNSFQIIFIRNKTCYRNYLPTLTELSVRKS